MLLHNLNLIFRTLKKYKGTFFINLIGLTAGLTGSILIYLWVLSEIKMDSFHTNSDRLYQVMEHQKYSDDYMTTSSTPGVLGETLTEEFPEFEYAVTVIWETEFNLSVGEKNIPVVGRYAGEDFFNVFSFPLIYGQPEQVLKELNSIVISKSTAEKLFGSAEEAMGKEVVYQFDENLIVSGIFEDIESNSTIVLEALRPLEKFKLVNTWITSWQSNGPPTYAMLKNGTDAKALEEKIADFIKTKNPESNVTLFLQKFEDRYLYGSYENKIQTGGRITYVRLFSIVALFILVIAAINFMNLSTAKATRRAKEIGLKKSVGASKNSIAIQFISESVFISLISLIFAVVFVWLLLPQFNLITGKQLTFDFSLELILTLLGFSIFTGILSGSYPAFYMSGFNSVQVLKGTLKNSLGEIWARRGLVIFQFSISIVLIVAVTVVYKQIEFVQNKNLGYKKENVVRFPIQGKMKENFSSFLEEVRKQSGVVNASAIGHSFIGRNNNTSGLNWEGKNPEERILFENLSVDYNLIETMNLEIIEGRAFDRKYNDDTTSIIINEAALEVIGFEEPVGRVVNLWDSYDLEIVGVVKDFHFQSLHSQVKPLFLWINKENVWNIMVSISGNNTQTTLQAIEEIYSRFNPGFVLDYYFMDEQYAKQYESEQRVASLSKYFAGFAILISCLGLFGLASFTAERRIKEIGIRKALGASVTNVVMLLSKDFTKLIIISILIALPVSYFLMDAWLQKFAFTIELTIWFFLGSGALALVITWLTVGFQSFKAASVNPRECLRDD